MKRRQTALILIACALLLAIGAYGLLSGSPDAPPEHRAEVDQPEAEKPSAPSWVKNGQEVKPDYTPSTADAQNATPEPVKEPTKPKVIEVTEDKVVTFTFVESLADFMLHRFHPQDTKGKPASIASAKALNMYYGRELDGFAVSGNDIRTTRKAVLDYAFTPQMIKTLYAMYAPVFMAHIVDTAASDERTYKVNGEHEQRVLKNEEIRSMLRLNALKIEQTASVFKALSEKPAITEMAGKYLRAAKAVERANGQLQIAISEEKDTSKASKRLKQAIQQRERIKTDTVKQLKTACSTCSDAELFYLAQWAYRRVLNGSEEKLEAFAAASEVLDDLAARFKKQAAEIK